MQKFEFLMYFALNAIRNAMVVMNYLHKDLSAKHAKLYG